MFAFLCSCSKNIIVLEDGNDNRLNEGGTNGNIIVPTEHPRLLLRMRDMEVIRENMRSAEAENALQEHALLLEDSFDGNFPDNAGTANYDGKKLATIESKAFDYLFNNNVENGRKAIEAIRNVFNTVDFSGLSDVSRALGHVIFTASEVYDWCYSLLTTEDKDFIIDNCIKLARNMEIGWPPVNQGAITSHAGEAQLMRDLMSFSIAVYDENPDYLEMTMGRYLSEFVQPRNYWYQSHTHHQGSAYGAYRMIWDAWGQWIVYRLNGEKTINEDFRYAMYNWIYLRRPDLQLFREGDDSFENRSRTVTWGINNSEAQSRSNTHVGTATWLIGSFYKDGVLKNESRFYNPGNNIFVYENATRTPVQFFLFNAPEVGLSPASTLPLVKYSPSPYGGMIARSGWDNTPLSNDVVVLMKIGELSGGNHHHQDAGNFQIFYKGILASESGYYDGYGTLHQSNYQRATVAHNCLLIYHPSEIFGPDGNQVNDGGQNLVKSEAEDFNSWLKGSFNRAKVLAHQYSATNMKTDYAYIKGDLTQAYTRKVSKVSEVIRSMLFVPTENKDFPALFVVFDKVVANNASFKKTFLLHCQEEPALLDKKTISIRNTKSGYNGMLVDQVLLPADAVINKIGGTGQDISSNRFYVGGTNYLPKSFGKYSEEKSEIEFGWGRIEVSPGNPCMTDYFLNVMYVKDADKSVSVQRAELIDTESFAGVKIFSNVFLFAKTAQPSIREFEIKVPGEERSLNYIVTGVEEGNWVITIGEESILSKANTEGGLLNFKAPAGNLSFKRSSSTGI